MRLYVNNNFIKTLKTPSAKMVLNELRELSKSGLYIAAIKVDDISLEENIEDYLNLKLDEINKINVKMLTEMEFMNDLILSLSDYLVKANKELKILANQFYTKPTEESWNELANSFEGLQWIISVIEEINNFTNRPQSWREMVAIQHQLIYVIAEIEESIKNKDFTSLADQLQYELTENYEELNALISSYLDSEVVRDDLQ